MTCWGLWMAFRRALRVARASPKGRFETGPYKRARRRERGLFRIYDPGFRTPPWIPGFPGKTRGGGYRIKSGKTREGMGGRPPIGVRGDEGEGAGRRWRRCGMTKERVRDDVDIGCGWS